jgi:hypothetical protein
MARSVNATSPFASLVAEGVPLSDPPPEKIAAVTVTPSRATGVPSRFSRRIVGWGESGSPETAMAGSSEVMTRRTGRPVLVKVTGSSRPSIVANVT